jgi:DNA-binding transcriptional ArsR family regulator
MRLNERAALPGAFQALGDPTRLAIVERLSQGPRRVTDLAQPFEMSLNAVSKHVKVLERAGLVRRTRQGREHILELAPEPLQSVSRWAAEQERFWRSKLDRLASHLRKEP